MSYSCNCCRGVSVLTPQDLTNRPGLSALAYRIGTYASFFETMKARLSSRDFATGLGAMSRSPLTTRSADDPAIALLDVWAIAADVLTFYQERIANEGYLRTATEQQSVTNLAGLVGYTPRPGVAASVFLAYTLEQNADVTIATGSKVQTIPGPGELPQSFEISSDLDATGAWTNLAPRLTSPQILSEDSQEVYVAGVTPNLKANDPVLIVTDLKTPPSTVLRVASVEVDVPNNRTKVVILRAAKIDEATIAPAMVEANEIAEPARERSFASLVDLVAQLSMPSAAHPPTPVQLSRSVNETYQMDTDTAPALLQTFNPDLGAQLYAGLKTAQVTPVPPGEFHALRVQAAPFGHNAPLRPVTNDKGIVVATEEWPLIGGVSIRISISNESATEIEGEGNRFGRLFDLRTQNPTALVQVSGSGVTGSAAVPVSTRNVTKFQVGTWELDVGPGSTPSGVKFDFPALAHSYDIELNQAAKSLSVIVDGALPAIQVPVGESSITASTGRRTLVSFANGITVDDEMAIAPMDPADTRVLSLDMVYDQILPGSWVAIERTGSTAPVIAKVQNVQKVSLTRYGMTNRVTQLTLDKNWLDPKTDLMLDAARSMTISAQSQQLALAKKPIPDHVPVNQTDQANEIELGDLYGGLKSGRWLVVQGERVDSDVPSGVTGTELVMLANVRQGVQQMPVSGGNGATQDLPGDSTHSFLELSSPLGYQYKRESVTVYGNVVRATHGESRKELLGGGDGSQELQQFTLHQSPVTYLPASNADGAQSTLQVRVNDVLWSEVDSLASAGPKDRVYTTQTDATGKRTITFGNGRHGMRLPTGQANVIAYYRSGMGSGGNADAGKISQLATRPLGVKAVVNPIPASGGADGDTTEQIRRNSSVAVVSLDRLVSISDYGDFARTFAGVGKATSQSISDGRHTVVFVTVAGQEGTIIAENSDLTVSLLEALQQSGDPNLPVEIGICEFMLMVISAQVMVLPGYDFTMVAPQIRSTLLNAFAFDTQEMAQSVPLSRVIATVQGVSGVQAVTVQVFDSIAKADTVSAGTLKGKLAEISAAKSPQTAILVPPAELNPSTGEIRPAAVAFLSPDLPDTLILTEISL